MKKFFNTALIISLFIFTIPVETLAIFPSWLKNQNNQQDSKNNTLIWYAAAGAGVAGASMLALYWYKKNKKNAPKKLVNQKELAQSDNSTQTSKKSPLVSPTASPRSTHSSPVIHDEEHDKFIGPKPKLSEQHSPNQSNFNPAISNLDSKFVMALLLRRNGDIYNSATQSPMQTSITRIIPDAASAQEFSPKRSVLTRVESLDSRTSKMISILLNMPYNDSSSQSSEKSAVSISPHPNQQKSPSKSEITEENNSASSQTVSQPKAAKQNTVKRQVQKKLPRSHKKKLEIEKREARLQRKAQKEADLLAKGKAKQQSLSNNHSTWQPGTNSESTIYTRTLAAGRTILNWLHITS